MSARVEVDQRYMREAARLAEQGIGNVDPNPPVGALVVSGEEVVGRGFHGFYGGAHAEVFALRDAGERAKGATLYVTLEPCSTSGKTPPCTDAVMKAGVRRVVVGSIDPNPDHVGSGLDLLRSEGIRVDGPIGDEITDTLLVRFRSHLMSKRPFVIAKWAMTLGGEIATRSGDSTWISCEESRSLVHELRGRVDGVLVGRGTVVADDPRLTARPPGPMMATRIVLDRSLRVPVSWRALADSGPRVILVHGDSAPDERRRAFEEFGVELVSVRSQADAEFLVAALEALRRKGIQRVLVEAGSRLLGTFVDARQIDRAMVFVAPKLFGGRDAARAVGGAGVECVADGLTFEAGTWQVVGGDVVFQGFVSN